MLIYKYAKIMIVDKDYGQKFLIDARFERQQTC